MVIHFLSRNQVGIWLRPFLSSSEFSLPESVHFQVYFTLKMALFVDLSVEIHTLIIKLHLISLSQPIDEIYLMTSYMFKKTKQVMEGNSRTAIS